LRGVTALEVKITGSKMDLHSGHVRRRGAQTQITALTQLLADLARQGRAHRDRRLLRQGEPLEDWEREAWRNLPLDGDKEILGETGSPDLYGEAGYSTLERLWARPTAEINGIGGGYQGLGRKR
jgi:hypothetical protein